MGKIVGKKYSYFMSAMYSVYIETEDNPFETEAIYEIAMPSPYKHNTKEEAMSDKCLHFRFTLSDDGKDVQIVIFKKEDYDPDKESLGEYLDASGEIIKVYTFEQFKKAGGYIRLLDPELDEDICIIEEWHFLETDKTFNDIFKNTSKEYLESIENESYFIQ